MTELQWTARPSRWDGEEPSHRAAVEGEGWSAEFSVDRLQDGSWRAEADFWLPFEISAFWSNGEDVTDADSGKALEAQWAEELERLAAWLKRMPAAEAECPEGREDAHAQ